MKTKLVLWASKTVATDSEQPQEQKVLVALELLPEENKVKSWTLEGEAATPEIAKTLQETWVKGEAIELPASVVETVQELSATLPLLSADLKADKEEHLTRTKNEWLYLVLSNKLCDAYLGELDELQTKVEALEKYNKGMWDTLKGFWDKVQAQVNQKSILREHSERLRQRANVLFDAMKTLRSQEDSAAETEARKVFDAFLARIVEAEQAIENAAANEGARLFDALKVIQKDFQPLKLNRNLRNQLWDRIDGAFKTLKEKRGPATPKEPNGDQRLTRRVEGLRQAIAKMEESIQRDKKDMSALNQRPTVAAGNSQLEAQLREVRSKLIQDRIDSKQVKLDDMLKTLKDLDNRLQKAAAKAEKKSAEPAKVETTEAEVEVEAVVETAEAVVEATVEAPATEEASETNDEITEI